MKILVFGSLNTDHVYSVPHITSPGETVAATHLEKHVGGKGLNQATALARAGADVHFAGNIGSDGEFLKDFLNSNGIDTSLIRACAVPTGHAIIQVAPNGENSILLFTGANGQTDEEQIDDALAKFGKGDMLLLQNEINNVDVLIRKAKEKGLTIALNPSPITDALLNAPLEYTDIFILNEGEAMCLAKTDNTESAKAVLLEKYPNAQFVMTLGKHGAVYFKKNESIFSPAHKVEAVDTTGAGDTFLGFFLGCLTCNESIKASLEAASTAAAIEITRPGAAETIPFKEDLKNFSKK